MPKEVVLSWVGEKLFISLILLMIFLLGATIGAIISSKARIKKLEDKIIKLEVLDYKDTQILEQIKTIKQFKEGSDRLEASISLKTVNVANSPGSLAKNIAEERHQIAEPSKHSKTSRKRYSKASRKSYHTVRDVETLYITSPPL
jgi:hypothetical protein